MFELFRLKSALKVWQIHYCEGTFDKCVRFQRSCAAETVPPNLLPNGDTLEVAVPRG